MELRLREHLAGLFNEQRKGQKAKDVRENPRAMAKLLREANRVKTVLSANADHMAQVAHPAPVVLPWWADPHLLPASWPGFCQLLTSRLLSLQIEGLMDDVDFKAKVTRAEFEELCADLFERVPAPVHQALQSAEMNLVSRVCPKVPGLPEGGMGRSVTALSHTMTSSFTGRD